MYSLKYETKKEVRHSERSTEPVNKNNNAPKLKQVEIWLNLKKSKSNQKLNNISENPTSNGIDFLFYYQ